MPVRVQALEPALGGLVQEVVAEEVVVQKATGAMVQVQSSMTGRTARKTWTDPAQDLGQTMRLCN